MRRQRSPGEDEDLERIFLCGEKTATIGANDSSSWIPSSLSCALLEAMPPGRLRALFLAGSPAPERPWALMSEERSERSGRVV